MNLARWIPLVAVAGLTVGCEDMDFGGERFEAPFHSTFDLKPGGRLEVETFNGSVELSSWDQNKVDISGTKYASSQTVRDAIKIETNATPDLVTVRTVRPIERHGNMGARFIIRVPRELAGSRITTSNGSIRFTEIQGDAKLHTSNGGVEVSRGKGNLDISSSNGGIDVEEFAGSAVIRTSNGHVHAEHIVGPVEATTSNGAITLAFDASPKSNVRATSSNSSITVRMPSTSAARLRAATSNSSITSDFEVATQGEISKNHLEGTINGGGALLDLSSSNGAIKIEKP